MHGKRVMDLHPLSIKRNLTCCFRKDFGSSISAVTEWVEAIAMLLFGSNHSAPSGRLGTAYPLPIIKPYSQA
jgi:hypothetical protein